MEEPKTKPTSVTLEEFIANVETPERQADAQALDALFRRVTGWNPVMWGPTMVGYGAYTYRYDSGHSGTAMATGFSPRKAELSLYVLMGYEKYGPTMSRLGKHRTGKACLYVRHLQDIDMGVLDELIRIGLADLAKHWPVKPS